MTLSGIFSSPHQKRIFLFATTGVLAIAIGAAFWLAIEKPQTPVWMTLANLLVSVAASGVFALISGLYLTYFFVDPNEIATRSAVLPEDIGKVLASIAKEAATYTIFVRTGRHFRSNILPILVERARRERSRVRIRVVLLDLRDEAVCERYANFRRIASFDRGLWNVEYVRTEVLATILALIEATRDNPGLVDVQLFLSTRLSTFRIEGTDDELLVTREDPKDYAMRYRKSDRDHSAFSTELDWICEEAFSVSRHTDGTLPCGLAAIFDDGAILSLEPGARSSLTRPSPYAR